MLAFRKRSSSWNSLVQQADGMTQRRFTSGQFSFLRRGLVLAEASRSSSARNYSRSRSVPSQARLFRAAARVLSPFGIGAILLPA